MRVRLSSVNIGFLLALLLPQIALASPESLAEKRYAERMFGAEISEPSCFYKRAGICLPEKPKVIRADISEGNLYQRYRPRLTETQRLRGKPWLIFQRPKFIDNRTSRQRKADALE